MAQNILLHGLERLEQFVNPLRLLASGDPDAIARFSRELGWTFPQDLGAAVQAVAAAIEAVDALAAAARSQREKGDLPDLAAIADLLTSVRDAATHARDGVAAILTIADEPALRRALVADLRDLLILNDLGRRSPVVFAVLLALGVIYEAVVPAILRGDQILRRPRIRLCLDLTALGRLLSDPGAHLKALYVPQADHFDDAAARAFISRACDHLGPLAALAGARLVNHSSSLPATLLPDLELLVGPLTPAERDAHARLFRSATLMWPVDTGPVRSNLGVRFEALPEGVKGPSGLTGPGLDLSLAGNASYTVTKGPWELTVTAAADVDVLGVSPTKVYLGTGSPRVTHRVDTALHGPFVLGGKVGPRLTLGALRSHVFATLGAHDELDAGFGLALDDVVLALVPGDGDAFLATLLPKLELRLAAALAWSVKGGLRFAGELGLDVRIAVNLRLPPVLEIPYIDLTLAVDDAGLDVRASALVRSQLGPLGLSVEGVGVAVAVAFDGDAPDAHARALPPRRIALSLVVPGVVKGAGFLELDYEHGRYGGAVAISTPWFDAAAIGVITTRDPWSFFISMGATFTPAIQLGYGFMMSGVGGLFAVNRELDPSGLLAALRAGSMRAVLFPQVDTVLAHCDEILGLVDSMFPVKRGSFVFGPMIRIDWGPGPILRAVLGVLISLPDPLRIAIVGQFNLTLPQTKSDDDSAKPVLVLNMDVLGIIDFGSGIFSLDGRLYDSQILQKFKLSGDIAFRAYFGKNPSFLLSVGGFHPSFDPPADVGPLERVTMSFDLKKDEDDPESPSIAGFSLKGYFALTSNTVQAGARFDFWVHILAFSIEGSAGFNAILWFKPFRIEFDTFLCVSVSRGEHRLLGIDLELHAAGPRPWHLWGHAGFEFLGISVKVAFDRTFKAGSGDVGEIETVGVAALLTERLADARAWEVRPAASRPLVLRSAADSDADTVLVPRDAALVCHTQIMPLARTIEHLGADLPADAADHGPFTVPELRLTAGQKVLKVVPRIEDDWFSPGKYQILDHQERLTKPSFERMPGIVVLSCERRRGAQVPCDETWDDTISKSDGKGGFKLEKLVG